MLATSFRCLEVFVETVEAGGFRECGDRLGISQASVSSHIKTLEGQIGKELFSRQPGSKAMLTEDGGRVYEMAQDLLARARMLFGGAGALDGEGRRRSISIGGHGFLMRLMAEPLTRHVSNHPGLDLVTENLEYDRLLEKLGAGQIDLGYFFSLGEVLEVDSRVMWREPIALYIGRDHPLAGAADLRPEQLARHRFLALTPGTHMRRLVDHALAMAGVRAASTGLETNDISMTIEGARLGVGFACLFRRTASYFVQKGHLAELSIRLPPLEARQVMLERHRLDPAVQGLARTLATRAVQDLAEWEKTGRRAESWHADELLGAR